MTARCNFNIHYDNFMCTKGKRKLLLKIVFRMMTVIMSPIVRRNLESKSLRHKSSCIFKIG